MKRQICLAGRLYEYELEYRQVKHINLRVRGDGSMHVSAPRRTAIEELEGFLLSREAWILRALERQQMRGEKSREAFGCEAGAGIRLFDESYRLRIQYGRRSGITVNGGWICLTLPEEQDSPELRRKKLSAWRRKECIRILTELCEAWYPAFAGALRGFPQLRFREMRSRWGSCMPRRGIITLNTRLAEHSLSCAEYVVLHEYTHFLVADHSPAFWTQMRLRMPDCLERRKELNQ